LARRDAISSQLPNDRLLEVHFGSPRQIITFWKERSKLDGHLRPNLKAASSDSGSDRDHEVLRPGSEFARQCLHCVRHNVRNSTAPTGVHRGHNPISAIGHQNRQAICGSNRQLNPGLIGNQGIAIAYDARMPCNENVVGVDLPRRRQPFGGRPSGGKTCTKAVAEPSEPVEFSRPVDTVRVKAKQPQL
jgi:hypothetical protein